LIVSRSERRSAFVSSLTFCCEDNPAFWIAGTIIECGSSLTSAFAKSLF